MSGEWEHLEQVEISDEAHEVSTAIGDPIDEVWASPLYEVQMRYLDPDRGRAGAVHLSIKRRDREADHDWRHLQAIKNEVIGWGREGVELYPAESRLVDAANQTHLWVMPAGVTLELGFNERAVATQEEVYALAAEKLDAAGLERVGPILHRGRQRPWQPGISTGPRYRP